jgi:hypothetical protein
MARSAVYYWVKCYCSWYASVVAAGAVRAVHAGLVYGGCSRAYLHAS